MNPSLSGETFAALQAFSAHTALTALSARSWVHDLDSLDAVLGHVERQGFGNLLANTHMNVHLDGLPRLKKHKAKDTPGFMERLTSALARCLAPGEMQTLFAEKTRMLAQDFWTSRHEALFDRTLSVILAQGNRQMLSDFAFDMVSMVPNASCMHKLLHAGVRSGETGATPCHRTSHEHRTLVHEAFLWGNLQAAEVLVTALPTDKMPALAKDLLSDQGIAHASHDKEFIKFLEVRHIHERMTASEETHASVDRLLRALDDKGGPLGLQIRNAVLSDYFERATCTQRDWTWSEEGVRLLMGAAPNQDLSKTPLALYAESFHAIQESSDRDERVAQQAISRGAASAIAAHCASCVKAFADVVLQWDQDQHYFFCMDRVVDTESMKIAWNGAVRPGKTERFLATMHALMEVGVPLTHASEVRKDTVLHHLAYGTNDDDRFQKLPILLSLGANPDAKNERGSKPRMGLKTEEERARWDRIVQTHQARSAAYDILSEMDVPDPKANRSSRP